MVARLDKVQLLARGEVVAAPPQRACEDRGFELPTGLLFGVFALFGLFLTVMSIGFMNEALVVPMAVNFFFVAAFAYVPAKWALMQPAKKGRALRWDELQCSGIETLTGRSSAGEAATLVLLLPACVLLWGVAVVTIAALV